MNKEIIIKIIIDENTREFKGLSNLDIENLFKEEAKALHEAKNFSCSVRDIKKTRSLLNRIFNPPGLNRRP